MSMKFFLALWRLVDDHKTQVGTVALLVMGYIVNRGLIAPDTAELILSLIGLATGGAIAHHEVKRLAREKEIASTRAARSFTETFR